MFRYCRYIYTRLYGLTLKNVVIFTDATVINSNLLFIAS